MKRKQRAKSKRSIRFAVGQAQDEVGDEVLFPFLVEVHRRACGQGVAVQWDVPVLNLLQMVPELISRLVADLGCLDSLQHY